MERLAHSLTAIIRQLLIYAMLFAAMTALWEIAIRRKILSAFYFGQPSQVLDYFARKLEDGTLPDATWVTLSEALIGFALGMSVGTLAGFGLWWSARLTALIRPALVALNAVPKVIFAPMLILIVGLGFEFKVALSFAGVVIVALLGTYAGSRQSDADQIDMIRSLGGSRWQIFHLIVVPTTLPWVIVSMEINIGLALVGAVVGEFLASDSGLGYLAVYGASTFDMSLVLVAVSTLMLLAAAMYGAVRAFAAWALPVRPSLSQVQ